MIASIELYVFFILISFLVSLRTWSPANREFRYLRVFSPFLLVTLSMEILGTYMASEGTSNVIFYNFFSFGEFVFYLFILREMIHSKPVRRVMIFAILAYTVVTPINILFWQGPTTLHTITYAFGCLMIVAGCIIFFLQLLRIPKAVKVIRYPPFWICSGLLFFYACGFPLYGLLNVWMGKSQLITNNFESISNILNSFLYLLFTIAFLWIRTRKSTLSPSSA